MAACVNKYTHTTAALLFLYPCRVRQTDGGLAVSGVPYIRESQENVYVQWITENNA